MKITYPTYFLNQYFDADGKPLAFGKVYTKRSDSGADAITYNQNDSINSNPVVLDESGTAYIRIDNTFAYKFIVESANGSYSKTYDKIYGVETTGGSGGSNDHTELINRDVSNQHPISAITGLDTALGAKVNKSGDTMTGSLEVKTRVTVSNNPSIPFDVHNGSVSSFGGTDMASHTLTKGNASETEIYSYVDNTVAHHSTQFAYNKFIKSIIDNDITNLQIYRGNNRFYVLQGIINSDEGTQVLIASNDASLQITASDAYTGIVEIAHRNTTGTDTILLPQITGETKTLATLSDTQTTLQEAYDNSTSTEIVTDATRLAFTIRRGSGSDTDNVFEILNGAGAVVARINGLGEIYSTRLVNNGSDILDRSSTNQTKLGAILVTRSSSSLEGFGVGVTGDSTSRVQIRPDGVYFGDGTTAPDNAIYRYFFGGVLYLRHDRTFWSNRGFHLTGEPTEKKNAEVRTSDTNVQRTALNLKHLTSNASASGFGVILSAIGEDSGASEFKIGAIDFVRTSANGTGDVYLQSSLADAYQNVVRLGSDKVAEFYGAVKAQTETAPLTEISTTPYAVLGTERFIEAKSGAGVFNLPLATGQNNLVIIKCKINGLNIVPNGTDLLLGLNQTLTLQKEDSITIYSSSTGEWEVI